MKNRETVRDALAALLEAKLVSDLDIVKMVVNHKVGDLKAKSPVVAVLSAGSDRTRMTGAGSQTAFYLDLQVWTLYAGDSWTVADAEDRADLVEQRIAEVVEANQRTEHWEAIDYAERSIAADVTSSGGASYLLEIIPLEVRVFG